MIGYQECFRRLSSANVLHTVNHCSDESNLSTFIWENILFKIQPRTKKKLLFCGQYSGMNGFAAKVELFYIVTSNICRCKPKLWKTILQNSECSRIRTCASRDEIPPTDPHRKNISPASKKRQSSQIRLLIGLSNPLLGGAILQRNTHVI